jgi:protein-S-isoprenylcysteine O-methyltransferase Ste14
MATFSFDPFGLLERVVPAPWAQRLVRAAAIGLLIVFLVHRLASYGTYLFKPLWMAETLIFVVFIVSYAVRADPVIRSRGVHEILVPLLGAVLPFALLLSPPSLLIVDNEVALMALFCWMTVSTALTVWGLWTLRRSFSITVEVRCLVTKGPYGYVRHPVYLGEIATAAAVAAWRFTPRNAAIFFLFAAVQLLRARREEIKLTCSLPGYGAYSRRVWWLW